MLVRISRIDFAVSDCSTRLPFRFGMNTMTWAPTLTARVELETEAGPATGYSADLCVPKWFEKDPGKSLQQDVQGLMESAQLAAAAARCDQSETVFDLWWRCYRERVHGQPSDASDRLVRGFGVALVERAVMDASCRAAGKSFFDALKSDLFGFRPGAVHPELSDWSLADTLDPIPFTDVELRHTIGLLDPLRDADISDDARLDDGLPESLEENIRRYGLRWFKLKLSGDRHTDMERCLAVSKILQDEIGDKARLTVDGNEQFEDLVELRRFFEDLDSRPAGRALLRTLQYIEQPLPRAMSLKNGIAPALAALTEIAPVILDEADYGVEAFPRALEMGYGGISIKNCKGVFRSFLNRGLCERYDGFQSAEDLTNLGVLALQQDLTTVAALGLSHVERNGHHYFHGLDHLPASEVTGALQAHPELWAPQGDGATLRIEQGRLEIGSLQCVGYGYDCPIDFEERTPLEDWRFPQLKP